MKFLSGFESTYIFGSGKDILELTNHTEFVEDDLRLARSTGLDAIRYSAPWHKIEAVRGAYDWRWMDKAMNCFRELGIEPILDPLHHTSFPEWLTGGFADPRFVSDYFRFVQALAERYPWVKQYTVINEPFVTTWFCGHEGLWHPYLRGANNFVPMLLNIVEAIISISRMLVGALPSVRLIHVDAAEKHRAVNAQGQKRADFGNLMRFLVPDLVLGRVGAEHELYEYLLEGGADIQRLEEIRRNPGRIDVIGLDYYAHCELEWASSTKRIYPNRKPEGLVPIAAEYAERYRLPVMLSETNIRGEITDRISWLKFMVEQCEQIERDIEPLGVSFEGFCWYPLIDSTDWCSLVRKAKGKVDPQGIFYLQSDRQRRNHSELSRIYCALAGGEITSKDIPAYAFRPPVDRMLKKFLPLMAHWDWVEPHSEHKTEQIFGFPATAPTAA